ncbi:Hypothetical predicted protein [Podarcis lilfordi]|uniref:Uncharacterized protein n=1 Tax=Podarcis lilfordi TaxID=74358 RepID=A0AA35L6U9_9SAUR|nr:Hypothetical predicted protein [Podarcis lilfordi]
MSAAKPRHSAHVPLDFLSLWAARKRWEERDVRGRRPRGGKPGSSGGGTASPRGRPRRQALYEKSLPVDCPAWDARCSSEGS